MGRIIISTIKIDQIKIPSVEPISKSISVGGGGAGDGVVPEPKAALKKNNTMPMTANKIVRDGRDSFFIDLIEV